MLVGPFIERILGNAVLLLELQQQAVGLLAVELQQYVLQLLLLIMFTGANTKSF